MVGSRKLSGLRSPANGSRQGWQIKDFILKKILNKEARRAGQKINLIKEKTRYADQRFFSNFFFKRQGGQVEDFETHFTSFSAIG